MNKVKENRYCNAFTLAEVLITLGIIGVVAAMTMPVLMSNYKKHVVEVRLQKFYSSINQAIKLSEVENGDKKDWEVLGYWGGGQKTDMEPIVWYNKYLAKYLQTTKVDVMKNLDVENDPYDNKVVLYFSDGSLLQFDLCAWGFYPVANDYKKCIKTQNCRAGREVFSFAFWPEAVNDPYKKYHANLGVEPYKWHWDGTPEGLRNGYSYDYGCNEHAGCYCTAVIQLNGWKIPKDYPIKF